MAMPMAAPDTRNALHLVPKPNPTPVFGFFPIPGLPSGCSLNQKRGNNALDMPEYFNPRSHSSVGH